MSERRDVDLEAEYDNRARVPDHPAVMAGWERDAATYRAARENHAEIGMRYGPHARQAIHLFRPDREESGRPLVVFIHGGYWRSLEPALFSHLAAGANAHGLTVAMPGYRLCPEVPLATIVEDLRTACAALWHRFGRKLVACGHSAGGHLAAAMAATHWQDAAPDLPPDLVRRGLAVSGIFDLRPLLATSVNESLRLDAETADAASPALWPVPPEVRFDTWVGATESSEYFRQSRTLSERWTREGAVVREASIPGANHFTAPAPLSDPDSAMTLALVRLCQPRRGN